MVRQPALTVIGCTALLGAVSAQPEDRVRGSASRGVLAARAAQRRAGAACQCPAMACGS